MCLLFRKGLYIWQDTNLIFLLLGSVLSAWSLVASIVQLNVFLVNLCPPTRVGQGVERTPTVDGEPLRPPCNDML